LVITAGSIRRPRLCAWANERMLLERRIKSL
jgi:hypothetical protein